jgi:hypothetical protein
VRAAECRGVFVVVVLPPAHHPRRWTHLADRLSCRGRPGRRISVLRTTQQPACEGGQSAVVAGRLPARVPSARAGPRGARSHTRRRQHVCEAAPVQRVAPKARTCGSGSYTDNGECHEAVSAVARTQIPKPRRVQLARGRRKPPTPVGAERHVARSLEVGPEAEGDAVPAVHHRSDIRPGLLLDQRLGVIRPPLPGSPQAVAASANRTSTRATRTSISRIVAARRPT